MTLRHATLAIAAAAALAAPALAHHRPWHNGGHGNGNAAHSNGLGPFNNPGRGPDPERHPHYLRGDRIDRDAVIFLDARDYDLRPLGPGQRYAQVGDRIYVVDAETLLIQQVLDLLIGG
ncbi:hypothetical protein HKCCE2091_18555 [Rhodobacterales bacterium HKCCE2091]|nr:hypothetical protein [Rhodobacterales bacterium HKCCE2091]